MGRLFISEGQDAFEFQAVGQEPYRPVYPRKVFEIRSVTYEDKTHYSFVHPENTESLVLNGPWWVAQPPLIQQTSPPKRVTIPPEHLTLYMIEEVTNNHACREFSMTRHTT